ncbi:catechol 2,3-dioxygenase-like lactoylglutathione lyase family enzyme [Caldalkalibacillus uzonensis]|uniref:Catechol 2,3-dioxygenase-like lactoylglutathione lyase family enzyme n=1 Tax=Caldalkalibacillus uzonensis TaxID=353224 RepID=A0ABU0CNU2_9BACI|nr:ArsI/CadI family heavy metal resistance metalloenzyme [Caldalkalibacillus uzonensis]MDQ0338083.1 catechol 2,3-dioxygenase-like lactoylglutathione lyase family enzyme [Caldalkalibacillus uzonensis]
MNVHIGLNVTDLAKSIHFYQQLFGEQPVKVKQDYAKFLPQHLKLNFTLNLRDRVEGNQVGHFGLQVSSQEELQAELERICSLGLEVREEYDTTCCYARQDKFWVTDPDGNEWEFFYTKTDMNDHQITQNSACCPTNAEKSQTSCC